MASSNWQRIGAALCLARNECSEFYCKPVVSESRSYVHGPFSAKLSYVKTLAASRCCRFAVSSENNFEQAGMINQTSHQTLKFIPWSLASS